ncbi:hypothetical protein LCGC14_2700390 [marine sediment metagenome]|uniref:Survival protein SurE-like phosphatase/nucleotidase domain-containing protein n=1 Tax=marine sediment metagenome TaxID=412755 RepID=A0A0F8ZFU6_9ZZZZ|nr:5'/3'-nucleotidase SurE [bacterium]
MKILLTNDDGIESSGLQGLKRRLQKHHDIWVVAPDGNRSASSHSISLTNPVRIRDIGDQSFSCSGSPADCVLIALLGLLPTQIELVISGINLGPNFGTDIVYSGTAAAARQAALMATPAIACSLDAFSAPFRFDYPVRFLEKNVELFRSLWVENHFLNINFPNQPSVAQPLVTFPSRRIYNDKLVRFESPTGDLFCLIAGPAPESEREEGSDYWAVDRGFISLSPILIHPTNHAVEEHYHTVSFRS